MNLRRQLLLVSLLTLILPWAGCQFIRETESALREAQQQMLSGTAQAIADSLSQFPYEFLDGGVADGERLYAHPLEVAPLIDGYADDWTLREDGFASLRGRDGTIRYALGSNRQHWYLHVDVPDGDIVFRRAGQSDRRTWFDRVTLTSIDEQGNLERVVFAPEAPGEIIALRQAGAQVAEDTRIAAYWRDTAEGYRLEARIPRNVVGPALGLAVSDTDDPADRGVDTNTFGTGDPGRIATISPVLQSVAAGYAGDGKRLMITDRDGWRLALAGDVSGADGEPRTGVGAGWLRIAYNFLLEPGAEALLAEPAPGGRELQSYIAEALSGVPASRWFRSQDTGRAVVSVAQPVWSGTVQTGAVVFQQGTDAILSLTNQALTRLILLTIVVTVVVAAVLIGYASWLSLRIRALSSAAVRALDEKRLQTTLPSALAGDEVGDLSRSFSSVLRRLGSYNDYLQSLAGKLSHELRTPLTIVRSSLENLEHETLSGEARAYTARAREGTDRLQAILNAMGEANRTEALVENIEPEPVLLGAVLRSTVEAYADAWPERKFDFRDGSAGATVDGSPELLIQMLDKLVDNAVDFSESGDPIGISLEPDGDWLVLSVQNPGPPLPEIMQTELFSSLVSVRSGDPGRHLGLGLYIARLVAEGHGGEIVAANAGDGVVFQVRLPANRSD